MIFFFILRYTIKTKFVIMKKIYLLLISITMFAISTKSQTTYYWVGGTGTTAAPIDWALPASWNTALDNTGTTRATPAVSDILIFDGNATNLTAKTVNLKAAKDSISQLKLINDVIVTVVNTAGNTAAAGTFTWGTAVGVSVRPIFGTGIASSFKVGDFMATDALGTNMAQVIGISPGVAAPDTLNLSAENGGTVTNLFKATTIYIDGNPGLTIDATSTWGYGLGNTTTMNSLVLFINATGKADIFGKFNFNGRGTCGRLYAAAPNGITFKSGSSCTNATNHSVPVATSSPYVFGNPIGSGSSVGGSFVFSTAAESVVFEAGATYTHPQVGTGGSAYKMNPPFGCTVAPLSTFPFTPIARFMPGSNFVFGYASAYPPYFYSGSKVKYGNLKFTGGGIPTTTATSTAMSINAAYIDTLFIKSTATTFTSAGAGTINIYGAIVDSSVGPVNLGTVNFKSATPGLVWGNQALVMANSTYNNGLVNNMTSGAPLNIGNATFYGKNTQTITSTLGVPPSSPTINIILLTDSTSLALNTVQNIKVNTTFNNNGFINFGTNTINGNGSATFNNNASFNKTYASPVGSPNSECTITNASAAIIVSGISTIPIGATVTSSNYPALIPPNTIVTAYSSGGNYTLNNLLSGTANSSSTPALSLTFKQTPGYVNTPQAAGLDASIISFAGVNSSTTSKYVFTTPTTTPFSNLTVSPVNAGSLIINGNVTLNKAIVNLSDSIVINSGILTIPVGDTLRLNSSNAIGGAPFSNTKFIDTKVDVGTGALGVLDLEKIPTGVATLFPVGTNGNYLPVTVTPDSTAGFAVTSFNGATTNGLPNGTPIDAPQKDTSVDANYIISRVYPNNGNTHNADIKVEFPAALKGANFAAITTTQVGIAHYNGATWDPVTGAGNATSLYATGTFSSFSPFFVTQNISAPTLPVLFGNINATLIAPNNVKVNWTIYTEINSDKYIVERSTNGINFIQIGTVNAANLSNYSFNDLNALNGANYYRIASIDRGSTAKLYSKIVRINSNNSNLPTLKVYPSLIVDKQVTIESSNLKSGKISILLYNENGQVVYKTSLNSTGTSFTQSFILPSLISVGNYQMIITDGITILKSKVFIGN